MRIFRPLPSLSFCTVFFSVFAVLLGGAAHAAAPCADDGGNFPKACTKEIRVYNNTPRPIWVILQASIQLTDAISCTKKDKGGGDVWLQVALGKTNDCFAVKSDYYAFINPGAGIPSDGFVSIKLPWWSKRKLTPGGDRYIDWWRGARVIIFDDRTALREIYDKLNAKPVVAFADGSPKPSCNTDMTGNACNGLRIFRVPSGGGIDPHLPFQLNEFTFASVCHVETDGTFETACQKVNPNGFINFNQGYNVSNVDQVYLPLAIEPVRDPADVGYQGTTLSVQQFRKQLTAFTNADNPNNLFWPIYNNPTVNGSKAYPQAGIRVPSAQSVFAFYMNPFVFPDGKTPAIIPKDRPKLVQNMLDMWQDCTAANPQICTKLQSGYYTAVNKVFLDNYKSYVDTCPDSKIPDYLKPVRNNPPAPKPTAFLTFVYGWVPFNVGCGNKELPVIQNPPPDSRALIDYIQMQYNYQDIFQDLTRRQWFNPYTQLVHDKVGAGGLAASTYAFSIDDAASFLLNSGGSLPGGLIFTVGGPKGLVNGTQHAPPVRDVHVWYDFSIGLGDPRPTGAAPWKKYGICSDTADTPFPTEDKGGFTIAVDPALTPVPCPITLQDAFNRKYQLVILKAKTPGDTLPQVPIWPEWDPNGFQGKFDPTVLSCPAKDGFVPPAQWCKGATETSQWPKTPNQPGNYTIGVPPPLKGVLR